MHAWARSRSGIKNRLTGHRMRPDGTGLLDEGKVIVDADLIPGWFTLEGPSCTGTTAGSGSWRPPGEWRPAGRAPSAHGTSSGRTRSGSSWSRRTPTSTAPTRAAGCARRPARTGSCTSSSAAPTAGWSTSSRCAGARTAGRCWATTAPRSPGTAGPRCRRSRRRRPPPTTTSPAGGTAASGRGRPTPGRLGRPALRGRAAAGLRPLGRRARPAQGAERAHSAAARHAVRGRGGAAARQRGTRGAGGARGARRRVRLDRAPAGRRRQRAPGAPVRRGGRGDGTGRRPRPARARRTGPAARGDHRRRPLPLLPRPRRRPAPLRPGLRRHPVALGRRAARPVRAGPGRPGAAGTATFTHFRITGL